VAVKAEKKQEQLKKNSESEDESAYKEALKHQFEIQSKQTQKRMKKDKRITENYYNKKLDNNWWKRFWFNKKRKNEQSRH
jgi:hypothetical protein